MNSTLPILDTNTLLYIVGIFLVALILGYIFWQKKQEGHIKTEVTHLE